MGIAGAFLLVLFVCFYIFSLYIFSNEPGPDYPTNIWSFHDTGHSKIAPLTILESLDRGEKDIFQLESGIPENPQLIIPIEWTQAEFIEVALALHQTVWKESWDSWNLYRINFFTPCKDTARRVLEKLSFISIRTPR